MLAKVQDVDFSHYQRVIAISDIHGDLEGFLGLLEKIQFTQKDALLIVGDIVEKGKHSLELLQEVMKLYQQGNIYVVLGNNDTILTDIFSEEVSNEDILWYMNSRDNSVLIDMAHKLNAEYKTIEDIQKLKIAIQENFQEEIQFITHLPVILESELATFVHAGIEAKPLEEQDINYCLSAPEFAKQTHVYQKPVVVGHWPASNYSECIIKVNAYYNEKTNVYSIDGANSMKSWQQINYLIFEDGKISTGYYDRLPRIKALDNQAESKEYFTLLFPNTLVEIRQRNEHESSCYVPFLNQIITLLNENIYEYKRKTYCNDFTTYYLQVQAGESLSFCKQDERGVLVKREGIIGYYAGSYEKIDE